MPIRKNDNKKNMPTANEDKNRINALSTAGKKKKSK